MRFEKKHFFTIVLIKVNRKPWFKNHKEDLLGYDDRSNMLELDQIFVGKLLEKHKK